MAEAAGGGCAALRLEGVGKRYPGTVALDAVDLTVRTGEVHALVGENGAGKSTLVKIIAGAFGDYTGRVLIGGREVRLHSPAAARAFGIQMIHQELSLAGPLSIAENILAGRLPTRLGLLDRGAMAAEARRCLERVGLDLDPWRAVADLSQHESQLVEIARALGNEPTILALDEPTSSLGRDEVERLFATIDRLRASGLAIIYISHHLPDIFRIADRVTVLRDGRLVGSHALSDVNAGQLVTMMVGLDTPTPTRASAADPGPALLEAEGLHRRGFFHDVSLTVRAGEIVGLGGLSGAGRSELARAIFGADRADRGTVRVAGRALRPGSMRDAMAAGVAYLTEDRKSDGLALRLDVAANALAAAAPALAKGGRFRPGIERTRVDELANALRIQPPDPDRLAGSLSGGNQQKVLLAKWMATKPRALILDEPTRGVDVGAKATIHEAIIRLAAEGAAVLLISSDLPELVALSDRALVMRGGRIVRELSRAECSEENVLLAANGAAPTADGPAGREPLPSGAVPTAERPPAQPREAAGDRRSAARPGRGWIAPAAGAALIVALGLLASPKFLSGANLLSVLQAVAFLGIVASGVCVVTFTGHYADLSVPSIMALSGIVAVTALPHGIGAGLACGLGAGLAVGLINGAAIGYLRLNPIIWTLASGAAVGGMIRWAYSGTQLYPDGATAAGRQFLSLYGARLFGTVPTVAPVFLLLLALLALLLPRTLFGFQARLTGASYAAARMSGVNVQGVTALAFLASALTASLGGILLTSLNKVGAPYIGLGYDFQAVTAVVLGGVALAGGRGSALGLLGGLLAIGFARNIMTLAGWPTFQQDIAQGLIFIVVVGLNAQLLMRAGRDDA